MAWTSGTADNYKHLLALLATFAAANGHDVLAQSETELYLRGEGTAGLDEIYSNIIAFESSGAYYNWGLNGSIAYRSGRVWNAQPRSSGAGEAYAYLWNRAIPYWFFGSPRRLIVVPKVSTVFQMVHLGLLSPPATEAQYTYPLLIGGCGAVSTATWSTTGDGNTIFAGLSGAGPAGRMMVPGGEWVDVGTAANTVAAVSDSSAQRGNILPAPDGSYVLEQIWMVDTRDSCRAILGKVDGVFRVSGYLNSAENIITISGTNYLVVPDVYRAGIGDFLAVRMD